MKKTLFILMLLIPIYVFPQWNIIFTSNNNFYALEAVNPDTVFVVGWYCAIKTFDGGQTWDSINYDCTNFKFSDVNFPNPQTGYIVGNSMILKTENYGNDWQQLEQDTIAQIVEAEFISADTGWIIGKSSEGLELILRTYNGGESWNYYYPDAQGFTDIQMINSNIGYITHWDGILKTIDAGNTWFPLNGGYEGSPMCCSFINPDTGFVGAQSGGLFKTENGGEDWMLLTGGGIGVGQFSRSQLQFLNSDTAYYAGYEFMPAVGGLFVTTNGGLNWNYYIGGECSDMDMANATIGYCIRTTGEIYKTINGGLPVDIFEFQVTNLPILYPNPFNDELNIDLLALPAQGDKPIRFEMFDAKGNIVYSKNVENPRITIRKLNHLNAGIYFYALKSGNTVLNSGKLLKSLK